MIECIYHSGIQKEVDAIKAATDLARLQLERRLDSMNEFRRQLDAQAATFISRPELTLCLEKLEIRLDLIEKFYLRGEGSSKWKDIIVSSIVSISILTIAHFLFKW